MRTDLSVEVGVTAEVRVRASVSVTAAARHETSPDDVGIGVQQCVTWVGLLPLVSPRGL